MDKIISLTEEDDELLYVAASALGNIADMLDAGEDIPELSQLIRVASMMVASVMAAAFERAIAEESVLN